MAQSFLDQWLVSRMGWQDTGVPPLVEQLRGWQLVRLREIVTHAQENSPFYAQHLEGVDVAAIVSLEDFSWLPFITPDHVRHAPDQLLCVSQDEIARVVTLTSSGTTGQPKRIFHMAEDLEATVDYFGWGMSNLVGTGQTALVLMPGDRPGGVGQLLVDALDRTGARAVLHGVMEDADVALDQCIAEDVQCLVGPAAHVNMLACAWEKRGLSADRIRSVLLCWDVTPAAVVRNAERIFGCRVYRHWGMIETGLGGAVDCAMGSGMHLRETDVFMEIVNPETGVVLPDGEFGEMVVTTPLRRGMPIIRYRTGDMGRIIPGQCRCGSPARRLDPLVYRMNDGVDIGAGRLTLRDMNEVLYGVVGLADFSAGIEGGTLHVQACGYGDALSERIHSALESIPAVGRACATGEIDLNIIVRGSLTPAIPGLGKRRLRVEQEN